MDTAHCRGLTVKSQLQLRSLGIGISLGDRVLVQGLFPGSVKYVGDLDSRYFNSPLYVGVKLDDTVGDTDGTYLGKRFFRCPKNHGAIVPVHHICLLVSRQGGRRACSSFKLPRRGRLQCEHIRCRKQKRDGVLLQEDISDSNSIMSHTMSDDRSTLYDKVTANSAESLTYEQKRKVPSIKMICGASASPGALKKREKHNGKDQSKGDRKKRKLVQRKKPMVSMPSSHIKEIVRENTKARSCEKGTQTLVITATSSKDINVQTSFNKEQGDLEMSESMSFSDAENKSQLMEASKVDRATSPGLGEKHEGRFSAPSCEDKAQGHQEKASYAETSLAPDKSHKAVQSMPNCEEETQTYQEKTEAFSSTRDSHCTDGILRQKVHNGYVTVNDQRTQTEIELDGSTKCSVIAEQVLDKMLRGKLCSGSITEHRATYENEDYLMSKRQEFLMKFYHTFVNFHGTGSSVGTTKATKGVSSTLEDGCCRYCNEKTIKSASEHSSLKYASSSNLKRELGGSSSATDISSTTPSCTDESEMDSICRLNQREGVDCKNDSRTFMSGLGTTPKSPSSELNGMKNVKKWTNVWGGGEKGFRMAVTVQKLHDAMKKGKKEAEWQKELMKGSEYSDFAAKNWTIKMLKDEILQVSRMASYAEEQTECKLFSMKKASSQSVNELKGKIEKQRKKNSEILERIYLHPMAANNMEYARNIITRVTKDFKEIRDQ